MPIFEYECPVCGRFEYFQSPSEKDLAQCPGCKEKGKRSKVKRLLSASSFHLKGSGWYQTDYKGTSSSGSSDKSESGDPGKSDKTEKKAAPKACGSACDCS